MRPVLAGSQAVGRFAPSPTGDLHFGSLVAAVASYLEARARGGRWLVRVEDIDPPREVPGSAGRILEELQRFGLRSDAPVLFQHCRTQAYAEARDSLLKQGEAFWCGCSRADLPDSGVYPGTCRNGLPAGKAPRAVRLRVRRTPIVFTDRIQGRISESLQDTCGDFVIWRADDLPAYQLAVVVDDAFQQITQVVRGADLLESTPRQIHLQRALGLPTPDYAHHPVAIDARGRKLSKRLGSDPLSTLARAEALAKALRFLGQPCPDGLDLDSLLVWALENWQFEQVPRKKRLPVDGRV
jgi:glutamyl-Q tRNA(Asp) synthetase